jgi:hypothetical protein
MPIARARPAASSRRSSGSAALSRAVVTDQFTPGVTAESGFGAGASGSVVLNVDNLIVLNGARVSVNTSGSGNAGTLNINARDVMLDGLGNVNFPTGLAANTTGSGAGGSIGLVVSNGLDLRKGGEIAAVTAGASNGAGGRIDVQAKTIALDGFGFANFTGIGARTLGTGNSGTGGPP